MRLPEHLNPNRFSETMTPTRTAPVDYSYPAVSGSIATQTGGLLVDAYRELHSKKLFWITLGLSLLVVLAFAFVGINERGITIFGKEIPGPWNTNIIPAGTFYRFLFTDIAIPWWLGFFAAILALVSVGGIFPDLLTGGSIDLYLSKPISRLRLFLTKYLFALLFVALQVLVFSAASFLVIGIRGGTWEPGIFLAVPLVTLFFSYLYCVCVLVGLVTRSTLAAILLTVLFWGGLFAINSADAVLLSFRTAAQQEVEDRQRLVHGNEVLIARNNSLPEQQRGNVSQFEFQLEWQKKLLVEAQDTLGKLQFWHNLVLGVKTPLPKTNETVDLMSRWLVDPDPLFAAERQSYERRQERRQTNRGRRNEPATSPVDPLPATQPSRGLEPYLQQPETQQQIREAARSRSVAWVVGTSVGFEVAVLTLAALIFCRRDY
jgi:ABC-type transport system involved in multi-copper enzyme maturation permease subunit